MTELLRIFLAISNALLYPVLVTLMILVIYVFFSIGKLLSEYAARRERRALFSLPSNYREHLEAGKVSEELMRIFRDNHQPLSGMAEISKDDNGNWQIADGEGKYQIRNAGKRASVYIGRSGEVERNIRRIRHGEAVEQSLASEHLAIFCTELGELVSQHENSNGNEPITTRIERLLQVREREATNALEKTRVLMRIGPMLGLMGTLIPLGPALVALSVGNIAELSSNLVVAFSSTVVGLLIGAVAMVINAADKRWYKQDLSDMEYTAERLAEMMEGERTGPRDEECGVLSQQTKGNVSDL